MHFKTINVKHKYFETFKNIFPSKRDTLNKISIIPVEQDLSGLINLGKSHENIAVPDPSKELIIQIISNKVSMLELFKSLTLGDKKEQYIYLLVPLLS